MRLGLGVAAVVGTLTIGALPAAAGILGAGPPAPTTTTSTTSTATPTGGPRVDADRGHGPPDHAKAWGRRGHHGAEQGEGRGPAAEPDTGRRHGQRMSAIGRRHGELMRAWARCRSGDGPARCGAKPTPPGHLKHPGHDPKPR